MYSMEVGSLSSQVISLVSARKHILYTNTDAEADEEPGERIPLYHSVPKHPLKHRLTYIHVVVHHRGKRYAEQYRSI